MKDVVAVVDGFEVKPGPKPKLTCTSCGKPAKYLNTATGCYIILCKCKQ